jgi:hypothetical protein
MFLGFAAAAFLAMAMLGGSDLGFFGVTVPILFVVACCGAYTLNPPKYIHFINLAAFLSPIACVPSKMDIGLLWAVSVIVAFSIGGSLRFLFTAVSFYRSAKKDK